MERGETLKECGLFKGKVALVTGSASGIGKATALAFAREGAKVVVTDFAKEGGEETVHLIEEAGGEAIFIKCDISKARDVEAMVNKAVVTFGRLDCAVNNAGIVGPLVSAADYTEEDWDTVHNVNLKGVWLCMKWEIIQMLKQGGGAIVNTASASGLIGTPAAAYVSSKHGVVGLTKSAALDYAQKGIRINAIAPGGVRTGLSEPLLKDPAFEQMWMRWHPMGRYSIPKEIAEPIVWLCSPGASFITGTVLSVDGGVVAGKQ